ncbi:MAG: class I SAM-dependent methyltransferase [Mycobacterium sp.]|nr:class I SAM-dependent methyltransferase [Mycobacterium sp.]
MDLTEITRFTEVNRQAWDAVARTRPDGLRTAESFARGVGNFDPSKLPINSWQGLKVLHLQCASGEDSLTLALAGAKVTGIDISGENVAHARRKASAAGLPATFVAADVYQLPPDLLTGRFDVVFTGGGALCWLPDISGWATAVVSCLAAGGYLLLEEMHPLRGCFEVEGERLVVADEDYFQRGSPRVRPAGPARLEGAADTHMPEKVEFRWPVGDIVTALARAGMRIELLDEHFSAPAQADMPTAILDLFRRLPNDLTLLAKKDRDPAD